MLEMSLIGAGMVAATVVMHAIGTTYWVRFLVRRYANSEGFWFRRRVLWILTSTALVLTALHTLEIVLWASAYQWLVPAGELETFEKAVYFSFVTFTTLGYGDVTLSEGWRLLSGIEAMNGILLVGWTTAMLFSVVQRSWEGARKDNKAD
jgi:voltage-gated potassium channel